MASRLTGDWKRVGLVLQALATKLTPLAQARLYEDGEIILEKLRGHIDSQDLNWTPLSKRTVTLKSGDDTIYVDTGWLKENLTVRRLKSSVKGSTIFVGATPWQTHPSGKKFSDLMLWLEYGTESTPPRPLIRPTWQEVQDDIKKSWKDVILKAMEV
jgi:hypothetical protein